MVSTLNRMFSATRMRDILTSSVTAATSVHTASQQEVLCANMSALSTQEVLQLRGFPVQQRVVGNHLLNNNRYTWELLMLLAIRLSGFIYLSAFQYCFTEITGLHQERVYTCCMLMHNMHFYEPECVHQGICIYFSPLNRNKGGLRLHAYYMHIAPWPPMGVLSMGLEHCHIRSSLEANDPFHLS